MFLLSFCWLRARPGSNYDGVNSEFCWRFLSENQRLEGLKLKKPLHRITPHIMNLLFIYNTKSLLNLFTRNRYLLNYYVLKSSKVKWRTIFSKYILNVCLYSVRRTEFTGEYLTWMNFVRDNCSLAATRHSFKMIFSRKKVIS